MILSLLHDFIVCDIPTTIIRNLLLDVSVFLFCGCTIVLQGGYNCFHCLFGHILSFADDVFCDKTNSFFAACQTLFLLQGLIQLIGGMTKNYRNPVMKQKQMLF